MTTSDNFVAYVHEQLLAEVRKRTLNPRDIVDRMIQLYLAAGDLEQLPSNLALA